MKIIALRRKIIINLLVSVVIAAACGVIFYSHLENKSATAKELKKIKKETVAIKKKVKEIESQAAAIEKYKITWSRLSDKKKITNGIEVEKFNQQLKELGEKYLITTKRVKINLPEPMSDEIFWRDTVEIFFTTVAIDFHAINDSLALAYVIELVNSLGGYPIVTNFSLKKSEDYIDKDFTDILLDKKPGAISGTLNFSWYASKAVSQINY